MIFEYVDLDTMDICSHVFLQRKHATYKNAEFSADELAGMNAAVLVEPLIVGDERTGKAVLVAGQYERGYQAYTADQQISQAKSARDAAKVSPLTVTLAGVDHVFDMDKAAQDNINNTIDEWVVIDAAAGGTGAIDWTLEDNSELSVTLADLHTVRQAAVIRGLQLHIEYQAAKAALTP